MDWALFLNALTGFFVVIDPIGTTLIFHSLIPEKEKKFRKEMAVKSLIISCLLLIVFGNFGEPFLNELGININSLRIAGGLLLFYTAFNMITEDVDYEIASEKKDVSVFPLSIPLLAGPGALTLSILLFSKADSIAGNISVITAVIVCLLITLVLMLLSEQLKRVIGKTGDEIIRRFLGVVLAALAIQFIYDGMINLPAN